MSKFSSFLSVPIILFFLIVSIFCPVEKTIVRWEKVDSVKISALQGQNENYYLRITNNKNYDCCYYTEVNADGGLSNKYVSGNAVYYNTDNQPRMEKWVKIKQTIHRNRLTDKYKTNECTLDEQYRFYIPAKSIKNGNNPTV